MRPVVFPIVVGEKRPACKSWTYYRNHPPTQEMIDKWLADGHELAVICGKASGGLQVIDIDQAEYLDSIEEMVVSNGLQEIWDRLPLIKTRKGYHLYFCSPDPLANTVLARDSAGDVIVEIRGEGGYVVCPNPNNHVAYIWVRGNWDTVPVLTVEERDDLLACMRVFDSKPRVEHEHEQSKKAADLCNLLSWEELLSPLGWVMVRTRPDGVTEWRRPGKTVGISATTGVNGTDYLYLFSSSVTGFEPGRAYSKFSFYGRAYHNGDFKAAAKSIRERFGAKPAEQKQQNKREDKVIKLYEIAHSMFQDAAIDTDGAYYFRYNNRYVTLSKACDIVGYTAFNELKVAFGNQTIENILKALVIGYTELKQEKLHTRYAISGDELYIDICDKDNADVIVVTKDGWKRTSDCPVKFLHIPNAIPITLDSSKRVINPLAEFRKLINAPNQEAFGSIIAWVLAAMVPDMYLPVLVLQGDAGSGKTISTMFLRHLIDPVEAGEVFVMPNTERDLFLMAKYYYVLAFDNLSKLPTSTADLLCTIATGGTVGTRRLYTDTDFVVVQLRRPVILNGIDQLADRNDLVDRTLTVTFERDTLSNQNFQLVDYFNAIKSAVFTQILDVLPLVMRDRNGSTKTRMESLQDRLSSALVSLGFNAQAVFEYMSTTRQQYTQDIVLDDPFMVALIRLLRSSGTWEGPAHALLQEVEVYATDRERRSNRWPQSIRALGMALSRLNDQLASVGVSFKRKHTEHGKIYAMQLTEKGYELTSRLGNQMKVM